MGYNICTPVKGAAVDRGGKGVVHDQRHAVGVSRCGKLFDVQHRQRRVCNGFAEHGAGVVSKGCAKAPGAAGKIHSDFERGFIRAEIVNFNDLVACGSYNAAREKGLVRLEGKEYVVKDGDIILFRFNV